MKTIEQIVLEAFEKFREYVDGRFAAMGAPSPEAASHMRREIAELKSEVALLRAALNAPRPVRAAPQPVRSRR